MAQGGDEVPKQLDVDYIRASQLTACPHGREGIGIDRLTMLLTDSPSIRDVIIFRTTSEGGWRIISEGHGA